MKTIDVWGRDKMQELFADPVFKTKELIGSHVEECKAKGRHVSVWYTQDPDSSHGSDPSFESFYFSSADSVPRRTLKAKLRVTSVGSIQVSS